MRRFDVPYLVQCAASGGLGQAFALEGAPVAIGRGSGCGLILADHTVSKRHATVGLEGAELWLRDAGSRNGTYVNGRKVAAQLLKEGDEVRIGANRFKVMHDLPAGATRSYGQPVEVRRGAAETVSAAEARWHQAALDHLGAIVELGRGSDEPIEFLSAALNHVMDLLAADRGAIVLVEEEGAVPTLRVDGERDEKGGGAPFPLDEAAVRRAAESREPVVREASSDPDARPAHLLVVPVEAGRELVGLVQLEREIRRPAFFPRDVQVARVAAALSGSAVRQMLGAGAA